MVEAGGSWAKWPARYSRSLLQHDQFAAVVRGTERRCASIHALDCEPKNVTIEDDCSFQVSHPEAYPADVRVGRKMTGVAGGRGKR